MKIYEKDISNHLHLQLTVYDKMQKIIGFTTTYNCEEVWVEHKGNYIYYKELDLNLWLFKWGLHLGVSW